MKTDWARGAAAGAVGTWAMDVVTWTIYRREDPAVLMREREVRVFGKDSAHAAAQRVARLVGSDAAETEPNAAGIAIHAALGMVPGALYPALRRRLPWIRAGGGAIWGAGLFVMNDEIVGRLLKIQGPQHKYPWRTHLRGLLGHVTLGVVTEATLNALEPDTGSEEAVAAQQDTAGAERAA